ncbi:hypothetical protein OGR47_06030 [Methylocystis sp. MJC1]|jgi:hypothetical protein|uniref:hypothetical protein n=1 Tax=Methylocystis sp. MJC1 TaxID=2654282 RepID=UPI0013EC2E94|nr:hypothetical protein [Methylocystis sp. MJC1]KAF2992590.1 hypothetical protein MJC1_00168 [Methylocystis sp. MJC1]MBU6526558.1 hypothetical protein [Methylocystis sp. MJC1]UZX13003.1 hypothetical protein OGR47_06030 [Methylocystis sp. MJC1]
MRKILNLALSGAVIGAMAMTAIPTEVLAGPMGVAPPATVGLSAPVDQVWYRRGNGYGYRRPYYGGYYRRGYNPGAAVAAGVGLGLLGAGLAASSSGYYGGYYPYYGGGYYGGGYYPYGYGYAYPAYNYWGW